MWMKEKSVDRPCIRIQRGEIISISSKICATREGDSVGDSERERVSVSGMGLDGCGRKNGSFCHSSFFVLHMQIPKRIREQIHF